MTSYSSLNVDWLSTVLTNEGSPISWLGVSSSINGIPTDYLQNLSFNNEIGVSYSSELSVNRRSPVSWQSSIGLDALKTLNIDWTNFVQVNKELPVAWKKEVGGLFESIPLSYVNGVADFESLEIAFEGGIEVGQVIPVDWTSLTVAVQAFENLPIDWMSEVQVSDNLPIDWSLVISVTTPKIGGIWILDARGTMWILP